MAAGAHLRAQVHQKRCWRVYTRMPSEGACAAWLPPARPRCGAGREGPGPAGSEIFRLALAGSGYDLAPPQRRRKRGAGP